MRGSLPALPEDPYLLYSTEPAQSSTGRTVATPVAGARAVEAILEGGEGDGLRRDLRGGPDPARLRELARASALARGRQLPVRLVRSITRQDKAVQSSSSTASTGSRRELEARMADAASTLDHLKRPPRRPSTSASYRAYLTPSGVAEVVAMLNWGGVSAKAQRTKTSCLQRLVDGEACSLAEASPAREHRRRPRSGVRRGRLQRPGSVELIRDGKHAGALASPRTANEYGIAANARRRRRALARRISRAARSSTTDAFSRASIRASTWGTSGISISPIARTHGSPA